MNSREFPLGRMIPSDWNHVDKYPLRTAPVPLTKSTPVVLGVNWYTSFDRPVFIRDGEYHGKYVIGIDAKDLGNIRGGHAVCIKPDALRDYRDWRKFYDQGSEGACVGFAASRMMTLLNRRKYFAPWLYKEAQRVDEWPGEDYSGTSVRAAMDVLRNVGHVPMRRNNSLEPLFADGIHENRWATTVDEIYDATKSPRFRSLGMFPILNSWGLDYPHVVWMPEETLHRLLNEYGEATLVTDR